MTSRALELLEEVKALSVEDRSSFARLVAQTPSCNPDENVAEAPQFVVIPDYAARLKGMFPNGPVIEDSQAFWDELRAERIDYLR